MEWTFRNLKDGVAHGDKLSRAVFLILEMVPCCLHLETRVGLKSLTMLLIEGLSNCAENKIFRNIPHERKRREGFIEAVQKYINEQILGDSDQAGEWRCPLEDQGKKIGTICLDNNRVRLILNKLDGLVDICIPQGDRNRDWKYCITDHYSPAMEILRKKTNLTEAEISEFQNHVDLYFQVWVKLHGQHGVTNYIHLLVSGHIAEYLVYWKSLYPHSQQGWEALNSLIKTFYFHRTNRGGKSGGKYGGKKSRVAAIGRWFLRRLMWACGLEYANLKEEYDEDGRNGLRVDGAFSGKLPYMDEVVLSQDCEVVPEVDE
jgi:hypothetical protein